MALSANAQVPVLAADARRERITLAKPDDFPSIWSDHGCPNCGIVMVGELTRKLSQRVERIDAVRFVSASGPSIWFRCGVQTDVCGLKTEFTADFNNRSPGCEGRASCFAWRFSTDGLPASHTFEIDYKPRPE